MKTTTSERLKEIMAIRSLKQTDILEKCKSYPYGGKISKSDLSQYVSGKALPKQDKLSILAYALNVSEVWLMGYDVPIQQINNADETNHASEEIIISSIITEISSLDNNKLLNIYNLLKTIKNFNEDEFKILSSYSLFINSQKN